MRLTNFRHRGLKRLYEDGSPKGVQPVLADKLRKLLLALESAEDLDQVGRFPGWRLHALKGGMKGFWSLTVSGNWRLVFRYNKPDNSAAEIDLIDYH